MRISLPVFSAVPAPCLRKGEEIVAEVRSGEAPVPRSGATPKGGNDRHRPRKVEAEVGAFAASARLENKNFLGVAFDQEGDGRVTIRDFVNGAQGQSQKTPSRRAKSETTEYLKLQPWELIDQ